MLNVDIAFKQEMPRTQKKFSNLEILGKITLTLLIEFKFKKN